jgi:ABC-type transport system involved in multi-copper enzyme maturation permease subunit
MALALGLGAALLIVRNTLKVVSDGYLTVLSEPFVTPLVGVSLVGGLFLALLSALSVARERELGTLETLFYGPVSSREYVLAKQCGYLAGYVAMIAAFLLGLAMLALVTHLELSILVLPTTGISIALAASLIGLGLLDGALMRSSRDALLVFVGAVFLIAGLQLGQAILTSVVTSQSLIGLVPLRDALTVLNDSVGWMSPASYFVKGIEAAIQGNWLGWIVFTVAAALYGCLAGWLAAVALMRKGVLR